MAADLCWASPRALLARLYRVLCLPVRWRSGAASFPAVLTPHSPTVQIGDR
eukprot:COSAG02_NODE_11710_length_1670_cov_1.393380_1_plen_50_part_10